MAHQRNVLAIRREAEQDGAAIIYLHERLCRSTCIDGQVLYSDGEHLTTAGAKLLQPTFVGNVHRLTRRSK
jgi:SGNH domain (fused to AT3 domains)